MSSEVFEKINTKTEFEEIICESFKGQFNNKFKYLKFQQTLKLSTYLYCFVAGEYSYIEYENKEIKAPCPLKIYFDSELLKYVQDQKDYIFQFII